MVQQLVNLNHRLIEKRQEWPTRRGKIILQHDNAFAYKENLVLDTIKALDYVVLSLSLYLPDLH